MKTLEEAAREPGIGINGTGLNLHFNPLPNWYGCIRGYDCPICGNPIDWQWGDKLPDFTNEESTAHLIPAVTGAVLVAHGHRWIRVKCAECQTDLTAENFDY